MKEFEILDVNAIEVIDSNGKPTLNVTVTLKDGIKGSVSVPSGNGESRYGAYELRDGDKRHNGFGVEQAVTNVNTRIADKLIGMNVLEQAKIDRLLIQADGTENKRKYGANAILGVSLACVKAASNALDIPLYRYIGGVNTNKLPMPVGSMINGNNKSDNLDIEKIMIIPVGADSFTHAMDIICEVRSSLKKLLADNDMLYGLGNDGGFVTGLSSVKNAFELIGKAVENAGYHLESDIRFAVDTKASRLQEDNSELYYFPGESKALGKDVYRNAEEMVQYYEELANNYPIYSVQDGLGADDIKGWKLITYRLGKKMQLSGSDLFETNLERLVWGVENEMANAITIKCSDAGTLTEILEVVEKAKKAGYHIIISRNYGETEDYFIADLSVALSAEQFAVGAPCRSDCTSKYNRMLVIENELNKIKKFLAI